jgi:hypothetical protein
VQYCPLFAVIPGSLLFLFLPLKRQKKVETILKFPPQQHATKQQLFSALTSHLLPPSGLQSSPRNKYQYHGKTLDSFRLAEAETPAQQPPFARKQSRTGVVIVQLALYANPVNIMLSTLTLTLVAVSP